MFELELEKAADEIKNQGAKRVLIQLPDGLKHKAEKVVDFLSDKTDAEIFIWFGACFGACDLPMGLEPLKIDLMIQWGHNRYWKSKIWSEE